MQTLRGHYDGQAIVLDEPVPEQLKPNTPVEIIVPEQEGDRQRALREWKAFMKDFWSRPLPPDWQPQPRTWKREDLYERGGKPLS